MKTKMMKFFTVLAVFAMITVSCGKDGGVGKVGCDEKGIKKYTDAASAFGADPTKANCEVMVNTLKALAKSCSNKAGYGDLYQEALADLEGACDDVEIK